MSKNFPKFSQFKILLASSRGWKFSTSSVLLVNSNIQAMERPTLRESNSKRTWNTGGAGGIGRMSYKGWCPGTSKFYSVWLLKFSISSSSNRVPQGDDISCLKMNDLGMPLAIHSSSHSSPAVSNMTGYGGTMGGCFDLSILPLAGDSLVPHRPDEVIFRPFERYRSFKRNTWLRVRICQVKTAQSW